MAIILVVFFAKFFSISLKILVLKLAIMNINIERIRGFKAGYTRDASDGWVGLDVVPCKFKGNVVYDGKDMPEWYWGE